MTVAEFLGGVIGRDPPVAFIAYDGSRLGPANARTRVLVRSPNALRRILGAPDELGFGRAYVAGDLEIDGDVFEALELQQHIESARVRPAQVLEVVRILGPRMLRPLPPPAEEARLRGRRHSKARDAAAVSYHYDVSNAFFRLVLGPSWTYSCGVWTDSTATLEQAQADKHELICRKLALEPGMRLLDIGCGWGAMLLHAVRHHGVRAVGVTLSEPQAALAQQRVSELGAGEQIEVRYCDYRDVDDGPYDAISSIGMFEHVGFSQLAAYFTRCHALLSPRGRFLNHAIGRPAHQPVKHLGKFARRGLRRSFTERYVFPDGELHEVGAMVAAMQQSGFEVRHLESLREHYALTLRSWVHNLESSWPDAVREAGEGRARVWRLYMAAAARGFERDELQVHQVLGSKTTDGASGMPLRPIF